MKARIYFEDEAPRIGCGWRVVDVKLGRKWVRVHDCLGRRARFTHDQYQRLKPQPVFDDGLPA